MSYDVNFKAKIQDVDEYVYITDDINHTWNGNKMISEIIGITPSGFHGKKATEVLELVDKCILEIEKNPIKYEKYMPSNGWGTVDSWIRFLKRIKADCEKYPYAVVEVC